VANEEMGTQMNDMAATASTADSVRLFVSAPDGLRLHVRAFGQRNARLPVVCLPGLARTGADFDVLARALSGHPDTPRGRSDYDPNPQNYGLPVELADILAALAALEIEGAGFVGTSHGGLLIMMMAVARPTTRQGL
jgi:pimeloyl-ACP methyl ester carboxylesterase